MATLVQSVNEDERYPDADELAEAAVVYVPPSGEPTATLCTDQLGEFESEFLALEALRKAMSYAGYFPNVYRVNERGNIDQLTYDARGGGWHVARGWV